MPLNLKELFRSDNGHHKDLAIQQGVGAGVGFLGAHQVNSLVDKANSLEGRARDLATRNIRKVETLPNALSFINDYSSLYGEAAKHRFFGIPSGLLAGVGKSLFLENKLLTPNTKGLSYADKLKYMIDKKKGDMAHFYDYSFNSKPELLVHQIVDRAPLLNRLNDKDSFDNFVKHKDTIRTDLSRHTDLKDLVKRIRLGMRGEDPNLGKAYRYINKYLTSQGAPLGEAINLRRYATPGFYEAIRRVARMGPVAGVMGLSSAGLGLASLYNAAKA